MHDDKRPAENDSTADEATEGQQGAAKTKDHHYQVPDRGTDSRQASRQMDEEPHVPVHPPKDDPGRT